MNSLLYSTRIRACGALLTGVSIGAGLSALTNPAHTVTPAAAQQPYAGHAGVCAGGAVTVVSFPASITLAEPTATLPIA